MGDTSSPYYNNDTFPVNIVAQKIVIGFFSDKQNKKSSGTSPSDILSSNAKN